MAGLSIVPKTTQVKGETNLGSVLDNGKTRDNELKPKQGSTFDAIK